MTHLQGLTSKLPDLKRLIALPITPPCGAVLPWNLVVYIPANRMIGGYSRLSHSHTLLVINTSNMRCTDWSNVM